MADVLTLQPPALVLLGAVAGTAFLGVALALPVAALALASRRSAGSTRPVLTTAGLMGSAVAVELISRGEEAAHLYALVLAAVLAVYRSWWLLLMAAAVVTAFGLGAVLLAPGSAAVAGRAWGDALIHGVLTLAAGAAAALAWARADEEARRDPATGLPNERHLLEVLRDRMPRTGGGGLACLELDTHQGLQGAFGQPVVETVLSELAGRLRRVVGHDAPVARVGGAVLAVALEPGPDLPARAAALQNLLKEPFDVGPAPLRLTACIGVSTGGSSAAPEDLLHQARLALQEAQRAGGHRIRHYAGRLQNEIRRRTELHQELMVAIETDQLEVHYQPVARLADGRLVGAEALVRWRHPDRGLLCPDAFVPAAERSGLIVPLGTWVMREACRQTAAWQASDRRLGDVSVAVNLSPRQLDDPGLLAAVTACLLSTGLSPGSLCLEITETAVVGQPEAARETLDDLRVLGVQLALDDFGTGFSSLSYLKELPVTCIKIDKSFVGGLRPATGGRDADIVGSVIRLAHALDLLVTAEGVETSDQVRAVDELGTDLVQGYAVARPLPADQVPAFLVSNRGRRALAA